MKPTTLPQSVEALLPRLHDALGVSTLAGQATLRVMLENASFMELKQRQLGPGNINAYGLLGIAVTLTNENEKLKTLLGTRRRRADNATLSRVFRNISVLAAIAQVVDRHEWPGIAPSATPVPTTPKPRLVNETTSKDQNLPTVHEG